MKTPITQTIREWHQSTKQRDFWPRAVHQRLIDATNGVAGFDADREVKSEIRIEAIGYLHKAAKLSDTKTYLKRMDDIEAWLKTATVDEIDAAFVSAATEAERVESAGHSYVIGKRRY